MMVSYPGLSEYKGLELTEAVIRENMPEYLPANQVGRISLHFIPLNYPYSHETHRIRPQYYSVSSLLILGSSLPRQQSLQLRLKHPETV